MTLQLFLYLAALVHTAVALQCACAKANLTLVSGDDVPVSILLTDECVPFLGLVRNLDTAALVTVFFNSSVLWAQLDGLALIPYQDNCRQLTPARSLRIVSRSEWQARSPSTDIPSLPVVPEFVYVHHGATSGCSAKHECMKMVQMYQNMHMDDRGWWDVAYSFMIGEDGNVYEGRGWDKVGAHTHGFNDKGIGICFIGDYTSRLPKPAAISALKQLLQYGVETGRLHPDYKLQRHCDVVSETECPGKTMKLYITHWEHYFPSNTSYCDFL